jgi:phage-related protein
MSTDPRREASFQLDQVQCGLEPEMWKPMSTIGASVRGIPVTDAAGGVRVMYVAKFSSTLYVLNRLEQKTQRVCALDIEWAAWR